jgi:hypothetical protein
VAGSLGMAALLLAGFHMHEKPENTRYAPPPAAAAFLTKHDFVEGRESVDANEQSYSDP